MGQLDEGSSVEIPQINCQSNLPSATQLHKIIERDKKQTGKLGTSCTKRKARGPNQLNDITINSPRLSPLLLFLSLTSITSLSTRIECRDQASTNTNNHFSSFARHASEDDDRLPLGVNAARSSAGPNFGAELWPQLKFRSPDFFFAEDTPSKSQLSANEIDSNITRWLSQSDSEPRTLRKERLSRAVNLEESKRAWQLLRQHTQAMIRNKLELIVRPQVDQLLSWPEVSQKVSSECKLAINRTLNAALNLDSWAVKLLSSWGNFPPVSPLDGTYSDLGSYQTCVDVDRNPIIGHAHHCSISFRPILPERSVFNTIFKREHPELLHLFDRNQSASSAIENKDFFTDLLAGAHWFRFVYLKVSTCWPIDCSPFDIKHIVRALGMRSMLIHGPIKCTSERADDYEPQASQAAAKATYTARVDDATHKFGKMNSLYRSSLPISDRYLDLDIYTYKPQSLRPIQIVCIIILLSVFVPLLLITLADIAFNRAPSFFSRYLDRLSQTQSPFKQLPRSPSDGVAVPEEMDHPEMNVGENDSTPSKNIARYPGTISRDQQVSTVDEQDCARVPTAENNNPLEVVDDHPEMSRCFTKSRDEVAASARSPPRAKLSCWLSEYSAVSSWQRFFHVSREEEPHLISCIDGLRVLAIAWLINNHVMLACDWSLLGRLRELERPLQDFLFQPKLNAQLVDTFFIISGILSAYTILNWSNFSKFSWVYFLGGRWLRLTPQMLLMTAIYIIFPIFGSGPNWYPPVNEYSENCMSNWWTQVLQVQSFVGKERICNMVTWWVSCDFSYQILATFIIYLVIATRNSWRYVLLATGFIISSNLCIEAYLHYSNRFPPVSILASSPQDSAVWRKTVIDLQWQFCSHTLPFFAGFYVGYLMRMQPRLLAGLLTPRNVAVGWTVALANALLLGLACLWWNGELAGHTQAVASACHEVAPVLWTYNCIWIIVASHHGHGGWLNRLLSCELFRVLSRATYMTYLAHPQIILLFYGNQQLLREPDGFTLLLEGHGMVVLCYLYGILLTISLEYPYLRLLGLTPRHAKRRANIGIHNKSNHDDVQQGIKTTRE